MTDQPRTRVEAVATAIAAADGYSFRNLTQLGQKAYLNRANDAIAANDAWLERHYSPKRTIKRKLLTEESDQ